MVRAGQPAQRRDCCVDCPTGIPLFLVFDEGEAEAEAPRPGWVSQEGPAVDLFVAAQSLVHGYTLLSLWRACET